MKISKMTRLEANRKIVEELSKIVERRPELRFQQILQNYEIVDPGYDAFFEESAETYANLHAYLLDEAVDMQETREARDLEH